MNIARLLTWSRRESRRATGRIALFVMCIAIGVAAIVAVAGLSRGVTEGIRSEGRRLMAGDVAVEGRRPIPPELDAIAKRFGVVARADVREFVSVALVGGTAQLVEVKIAGDAYPFYGTLKTTPQRPRGELLTADGVLVAPELLAKFGLKPGDAITLGGARFAVAGTIDEEPDKLGTSFTLGPRVFLSDAGARRTSLLDVGARVEYRALLKLPDGATAEQATALDRAIEGELPDAEFFQTRTFVSAQASLRRSFENIGKYLGLVGLLSLLIGGVGVAQVARAWIAGRTDDVAVMRCLGATPAEVVVLFVVQVAFTALLASTVGAAIGMAILALIPKVLSATLLPIDLVRPWQPMAAVTGVALGVGVAMLFTLPPLLAIRRVSPSRVLRRDVEPMRGGRLEAIGGAIATLAGIGALAAWRTGSTRQGVWFLVAILATILVLGSASLALVRAARLWPRDAGSLVWRHGLARLARPGAGTLAAIVALGLGVSFVFTTRAVQRQLDEQLTVQSFKDAPTAFFLDVQPDQWPKVEERLKADGGRGIDSRPIITARFAAIDGKSVDELSKRPAPRSADEGGPPGAPRRWQLTREQRVTYGERLPDGNRVTRGRFPSGERNGVSVEEGYARGLGVTLGSTITLDVQGVPIDLKVTSLRTVDWRTFGINFFLFAEPGGPLTDAPQQRVATARLPDTQATSARVVSAFPNVTVIPVADVMEKVLTVLDKMSFAVRVLGGFIVVAGTVVLGGTVAASQARRAREVALLKTIGMTGGDVMAMFAIEYALVGAIAATVGVAAGSAIAYVVVVKGMELPGGFAWKDAAATTLIAVILSVIAGLAASVRALRARPLEVLRAA